MSILSFGLIVFWYSVAIPSFNNSQMEDFTGIYILHKSSMELLNKKGIKRKALKLTLSSDGTYKYEGIKGLKLDEKGIWKTGGVDGMFEFDVQHGTEFASPSGSGDNSALSFEFLKDENDWKNTERILFVKQ